RGIAGRRAKGVPHDAVHPEPLPLIEPQIGGVGRRRRYDQPAAVALAAKGDGRLDQPTSDALPLTWLAYRHALELEHMDVVRLDDLEMAHDRAAVARHQHFASAYITRDLRVRIVGKREKFQQCVAVVVVTL